MQRYYFIVNPISGAGRGKAEFEKAAAILREKNVDFGFVYTQKPREAIALAKAALENGETCIVAVGGDGTVNEVASVLASSGAAMGILPFGTGNDLAQSLSLPLETEAAVEALLRGVPQKMDAALANGALFINVAGFGFDVDVVRYTEKYKKRMKGMLPYLFGIMESLMHLKPIPVTVEPDAGEPFSTTALLFSACNGRQFAGGIKVAPLAQLQDGLLDVCILKGIGKLAFLKLLPKYIKGKHLDSEHIVYFKAKSVTAKAPAGMCLNLDGELGEATPVTFTILSGALNILIPAAE